MSRRLSVRIRQWASEPDRLAVAVIVAGVVLTIGLVVLGGFVRYGELLVAVLYTFAALLPATGVVIAFGALLWASMDAESGEPPLLADLEQPPERGRIRSASPVASETASTLTYGSSEWYRCRNGAATEKIGDRLRDGAVRALRSRRGLERSAAREAIRSGTWTDDRVAAAFLADEVGHPPQERRRAAVDPGAAFDRRVRRTLAAIEEIGDEPRSLELEPEPEPEPAQDPDPSMQSQLDRDDGSRSGSTRDPPRPSTQREGTSEPAASVGESPSEATAERESIPEAKSERESIPEAKSESESTPEAETGANPKTAEVDR